MARASHQGFTLIEMMVTVAISAILIGIAVPSIRDIAIKNRLTTYANTMIGSINTARSEAVRRASTITICHSNDQLTCSGTWNDGWIVFVDSNNNQAVDSGEVVLKVYEALATNYSLGTDTSLAAAFTYGADGSTSSSGILAVCYNNDRAQSRAIVLTRLRPRVARDTDGDGIPNRDDNTNIASCTSPGA